jgi:peptide/nickel transport system permease protein
MLTNLADEPIAALGLSLIILAALASAAAPIISPYEPTAQSLKDNLLPPWSRDSLGGLRVLGTDQLGRDVFSRLLYGSRASLVAGVGVVLIAGTSGTLLGIVAGYTGGLIDTLAMRAVDVLFSFPGLLVALTLARVLGPSLGTTIVILSLYGWMIFARMARGSTLSVREEEFIEAAKSVGCTTPRILLRHVFPNLLPTLLTLAVLEIAATILAESSLSFLGFGIQPPKASWGLMIAEGSEYIVNAWWLVTCPGVAITLLVISMNVVANRLRVLIDPYQRGK